MTKKIFKMTILDFLKCCVDTNTNLQQYYVGDSVGVAATAGLGLPPMALTDGAVTGVQGQTLSSIGELFFFLLYQARKYVLTSWYCNSFIHSFCPMGYYFLLVSLGITQDLLTHATGTC